MLYVEKNHKKSQYSLLKKSYKKVIIQYVIKIQHILSKKIMKKSQYSMSLKGHSIVFRKSYKRVKVYFVEKSPSICQKSPSIICYQKVYSIAQYVIKSHKNVIVYFVEKKSQYNSHKKSQYNMLKKVIVLYVGKSH